MVDCEFYFKNYPCRSIPEEAWNLNCPNQRCVNYSFNPQEYVFLNDNDVAVFLKRDLKGFIAHMMHYAQGGGSYNDALPDLYDAYIQGENPRADRRKRDPSKYGPRYSAPKIRLHTPNL